MDDSNLQRCLVAFVAIATFLLSHTLGANVVIQIPNDRVRDQDGIYRLDYWPPQGNPPPNSTFSPEDVARGVELTRALPGTKYDFHLYYSNDTINDWPTWTASITTVPPPPSNLSISVRSGKVAQVSWEPPHTGGYSHFKLKVIPLSEPQASVRNVVIMEGQLPFNLRELTPGASYELQLYTVYEGKESAAYISSNFTTRPNAPGRFIVWYRNQTTMLVLWQPPYPPGIYSHYKVSIDPQDSVESVLLVEKGTEPPGPAQASFHGLVPGRTYNITVETLSRDQISVPTMAPYRTIPLRPENITFDYGNLKSDSFTVMWQGPKGFGEFDRYQLSLGVEKQTPLIVAANEPRRATFNNLNPGQTYTVLVKTVAGNVASWPTSKNITTRPLKVSSFNIDEDEETGITLSWHPNPESKQDEYKIVYQEVEAFNGDSRTSVITATSVQADLYPGRNYSVAIFALSNSVESLPVYRNVLTKPASPIIEEPQPFEQGLNVSWKSDVTSKQEKYEIVYSRNDTGETVTRQTVNNHYLLEDLYPGAGYEIKVYAISHAGLRSEPHTYFQAVYPNPVRNLTIVDSQNTSVKLEWLHPLESLFSHYVCRYHTVESLSWTTLPLLNQRHITVNNLIPGERYLINVSAVSHRVESPYPQQVQFTVPPSPVRHLERRLDSRNITFEWPRPEGRIDFYTVIWWNANTPEKQASKEVSGNKATEGIDRKVSILIGELMPGELYNFKIFTTAHDIRSDEVTTAERTVPIITSDLTIVNRAADTQSFTIRYTPTPLDVSTFDLYRFVLSDPTIPVKEKSANDPDRKIIFDNLVPGRQYNITAWTVSGGVTSHPLIRQNRLYPEPITNINATFVADSEITLSWQYPAGDYDGFQVEYIIAADKLARNKTDRNSITIFNLRPHRNYTFTVVTLSGRRQSSPYSEIFTTSESTPGKVREFELISITPNTIDFRWDLPSDEKNGVILGYKITYQIQGANHIQEVVFGPEERRGTITNLIPGKLYLFKIQARTKVGLGNTRVLEQRMPIEAPPRPPPEAAPVEVSKTSRTITISFRKNLFSSLNGEITNYTVIVLETGDVDPANSGEVKTWSEVQNSFTWPAYQVPIPSDKLKNSSTIDFTIGEDPDCHFRQTVCNGPLKPGSSYRIKIRAYTSQNKYTDTAYSRTVITDFERSNVGIAVAIPVVLVILAVIAFVIFTRRRVGGPFLKKTSDVGHRDDVHSFSDSIIETSRPVKLCDFIEHYRYMSADSDFRFSEEYEALKNVGRSQPCLAADLPVNRPKNRFTNILPYDHSRVKLQPTDDEEGSDYCNANYVPGFNSPREFVVTQGPLASTRDDYWRMVWETNSKAIIMLTRCIEKGREKCDHYWPYDTKTAYYGDIAVTILNESHYPDWTISEFRVCKDDVCRIIRHFHFTTWPDFGVPDPPQTLVRFVRAFRERVSPDQKPIVVHCSAGVGRSGTFIALDRILQSIRVCDYVDIFGIVYEMRKERGWMVQNEQQYICIHQCLLTVLEGRENEHLPTEIHDNEGFDDDEGIAESGM